MTEQETTQEPSAELEPGITEGSLADEALKLPPLFAPSKAAKYPFGVVYKAPWETEFDGVAIAARRGACALRRTGVPVFLQSETHMFSENGIVRRVIYSDLPTSVLEEVDHITDIQHDQTILTIRHVVPTKSKLESILYPREICSESREFRELFRKTLILYSAWESNVLENGMAQMLNMFGRLWVPCSDNRRWLEASGVDAAKIDVIPHPLAFRDPMRSPPRGAGPRPFRFLNIGKWEPRKAQDTLIGGFLIAFTPSDDVQLVMKSTPFATFPGYPESPAESIKLWLQDPRVSDNGWTANTLSSHLEVLWPRTEKELEEYTGLNRRGAFSRSELARIYAQCDCYVSAGRCEGFDLPAFDAKVMGLRLIAPAFGGPRDFLVGTDVLLGAHFVTPRGVAYVKPTYRPDDWYLVAPGTMWAGHTASDVALAMKSALNTRESPQTPFPTQDYTIDAVGAKMRNSLNKLSAELGFDLSAINVNADE